VSALQRGRRIHVVGLDFSPMREDEPGLAAPVGILIDLAHGIGKAAAWELRRLEARNPVRSLRLQRRISRLAQPVDRAERRKRRASDA
jgi:hypothetical protein